MGISKQRPTTGQSQKVRDFGALSIKWDVFIKSLPQGSEICAKEGNRKTVQTNGDQ